MTTPDPEPRRVEPTGNPRVDALIDALVCPSCRTIYNAAKAKCADLWHSDNQPATAAPCSARYPSTDPTARIVECDLPRGHEGDHVETDTESSWPACCPGESLRGDPHGMHTHDCPVYLANVAGWEASRARAASKLATHTPATFLSAYECGVAEGRRQATEPPARPDVVPIYEAVLGALADEADNWTIIDPVADSQSEVAMALARAVTKRLQQGSMLNFDRPWEVAEQAEPIVHKPGCVCGYNDAGHRFIDLICRRP